MKVYKDAWTIRLPARGIDGLNVHFEARRPGELQVDIEVFPYEGSIEKNAIRLEELRRHMEVKQDLIEMIRTELSTDAICVRQLGVSTRGLRDAAVASTLCAVKFLSEHGENTTAEADAAFVAQVIDYATPILDRIIQRVRP